MGMMDKLVLKPFCLLDGLEQDVWIVRSRRRSSRPALVPIRFAISLLLICPFRIASLTSQDNTRFHASVVTPS